ncbi:MAG: ORF6N domain-containing protein [Elusimicrobia bacterium]|nr:ORF6N domain-containing protein [Elusimicrobiota bacterium]
MGELGAGRALERRIYLIRGHRVMLDSDLATLYGVATGRLNEQVRRNIKRFPKDFMFQLTKEEFANLISRFAISSSSYGGRRKLPLVFTQEGVAMLSGILNSPQAIRVNIAIMRAFVKLRETLALHKELAVKLADLERRVSNHDGHIRSLFEAIRRLMDPPVKSKPIIGFRS